MKPPIATEAQIQFAIVDWLRRTMDCFVFHIPNGGARNAITGAMLKRQGVVAGVADICVLFQHEGEPRTLFIEVKKKGGYLSDAQREFKAQCERYGHDYLLARSLDEVREWWGEA